MNQLPFTELYRRLQQLETNGLRTTLLGIGPMSAPIVRASLEIAQERDFPILFIASRNQVDRRELGGGYVASWDQGAFVGAIRDIAAEIGFAGLYYICRDHGGPWHRDEERREKMSEKQAMDSAKGSYLEDLLQGFDLLHIDPTRDPHQKSGIPMDLVIRRTVELIAYVEEERSKRRLPEVCYEAGTEETDGGLTSSHAYGTFISRLNAELEQKGLPKPLFIVGQTGTLTRLTRNVGQFQMDTAAELSAIARSHGAGIKEHNADYLADRILLHHPLLGITAANVAPEYGVEESRAYLALGRLEAEQNNRGLMESSGFLSVFTRQAVLSERWRKWMTGADSELSVDAVLADETLSFQLTEICGHYVFDQPPVREAIQQLFALLSATGHDPESYVHHRIKRSIGRYVDCFNLQGLSSLLRSAST